MQNAMKLPFYAKASLLSVGIVAFVAILYVAQDIIVPLIFGTIIAVLLHPVVAFFERKKVNRIIAISIALLLAIILIAALAVLIFRNLAGLANRGLHWSKNSHRFLIKPSTGRRAISISVPTRSIRGFPIQKIK